MYFNEDYLNFFKELAANNNRDWFHANKKRYENSVKKPFTSLVEDVISKLKSQYDPKLDLEVKNAVFRINRDIRFSNDKSPYKLHSAAVISRGGRKDMTNPGIYLMLGPEYGHIGGGLYMPSKDQLYTMREAIASDHKGFQSIVSDKTFRKYYPEGIIGEKNKIVPKEFKEAAEKEPLIFNKQFYFMAKHEPDIVMKTDLADIIVSHYGAAEPFNGFIRKTLKLK